MYSSNDIEVFIASHNRPQYVRETIQSFLDQSVKGFDLVVLDNSDSMDVIDVLEDYRELGVVIIPCSEDEPGGTNNFLRAQYLARKEWVIVFHDDDIIHPRFIEHVLKTINENQPEMIASLTELADSPSKEKWMQLTDCPRTIIYSKQQFVAAMFKGIHVPFCSIVYQREQFKKQFVDLDKYGKILDRPFLYDCIGEGKVVLLHDIYTQTRVHAGRDTDDYSNGPFKEQWYALLKKYRDIMGDSFFTASGRTFLNRGTRTLLITMNPHIYQETGKKRYVDLAVEAGAISRIGYYIGLPYYYLYKLAKQIVK